MRELTADNVVDYCRERGWIGPGPAAAEFLAGGVSNAVFRVTSGPTCFVLKQARPQLRTREAWFSDVDRVWREVEVMQALGPLLPAYVVPVVLHQDREEFTFAMSHAPPGSVVWKGELLAGRTDRAVAEQAGRVLGLIHQRSAERRAEWAGFAPRAVFDQLRTDPFYRKVRERRPEVDGAVDGLIDELRDRTEALCHGDFSPKNVLVHGVGFMLVDYETAHLGDPAMDPGFFLSHLLLKACRAAPEVEGFFALTRSFWAGYDAEARFRPAGELCARAIGHLGVCLLARVDGTSPVDYLPDEARREAVRVLARGLLLERPVRWEDVLERAGRAFAAVR